MEISQRKLKTSDFDYELPERLIAQEPIEPRDAARLMVFDRSSGTVRDEYFRDLGKLLRPGDLLVMNKTRVIPARLFGRKIPSGGRIELLLLNKRESNYWEVLVGGKGLTAGKQIELEGGQSAIIEAELGGSRRLVRFAGPIEPVLDEIGHVPLPPYIRTPIKNPERYQTVYAYSPGSAAAPTAGLHFTPELLSNLKEQGIFTAEITLHIGLDTFAPVSEQYPLEHQIHTEWCQVDNATAAQVNDAHRQGSRIIAVGTSSVRAIESAARFARGDDLIGSFEGSTELYILPGFKFKVINSMITNFHLPRSTLIMLVSAFVGRERILELYQRAIREEYRFYSFGDAMLII